MIAAAAPSIDHQDGITRGGEPADVVRPQPVDRLLEKGVPPVGGAAAEGDAQFGGDLAADLDLARLVDALLVGCLLLLAQALAQLGEVQLPAAVHADAVDVVAAAGPGLSRPSSPGATRPRPRSGLRTGNP